jgi:hypothetical protein
VAGEPSFAAVVKIDGINPYVNVPPRVMTALGGRASGAVLVKIAPVGAAADQRTSRARIARDAERLTAIRRLGPGGWFRTTLVRIKGGIRLYLDTWMRRASGTGVGDRVRVTVKPDRGARELPVPAALRQALEADGKALAAWSALAPSRRREVLSYLNFLKTPEALARNVRKVIGLLVKR